MSKVLLFAGLSGHAILYTCELGMLSVSLKCIDWTEFIQRAAKFAALNFASVMQFFSET